MKEAAGEANLTVVAIILIAVVVAVATPLINSLMSTSGKRSCCTDAGGVWESNGCYKVDSDGKKADSPTEESKYYDSSTKKCAENPEV